MTTDNDEISQAFSDKFQKRTINSRYTAADIEHALRESLADHKVENAQTIPLDTAFANIADGENKKNQIIATFRTKMDETSFPDSAYTKFDFSKCETLQQIADFMKRRLTEHLRFNEADQRTR